MNAADSPPPAYNGPGDAHSQQEWVWRRRDYEALFAAAPERSVRLESTPFCLFLRAARRRIAEERPEQRTALLTGCQDDIARLEKLLGESFADWRSPAGRGSFADRTRTP